ncbi:hypothetical protein [Rasiella sp. SM2506]|uniref:hypothetical protein n=1 Tax=Rasiella sp. SM2506 TaxID=3423914 RepID=UPI003D7BE8CC
MRKFVVKISFLLAIIVLALTVYLDSYFRTDEAYAANMHEYVEQDKVEIAIFGSSHALNAYDPRVFENELALNTYNFGGTSQQLTTTEVLAKMVLNEHDVRLGIIDIFSMSVWPVVNERGKSLQLHSLDYVPFSVAKSKKMMEMFDMAEWPYAFSETLRYHEKWSNTDLSGSPFTEPYIWNGIDAYKGYRTTGSGIEEKTWNEFLGVYKRKNKEEGVPEGLTHGEKQSIDAIIDIFKKHETPILFVNAPSYLKDHSNADIAYVGYIKSYLSDKHIPYIDFNQLWEPLELDATYFKDPNHVNSKGALSVSSYLTNYIRDSLKIVGNHGNTERLQNRYFHIEDDFKKVLFSKKMDTLTQEKLFGITSVNLYRIEDNRIELLFEVENDTTTTQPIRLEITLTEEEQQYYPPKAIIYAKGKAVLYGEFNNQSIISYKGVNFIPYTFNFPFDKIKKMEFFAGHQRRVKVFTIENLTTKL